MTNQITKIVKWIFAIIFLTFSLGAIFGDKVFISFIAFALIGLLLLPPLDNFWKQKLPFLNNLVYKGLAIFSLIILAAIGLPKSMNPKTESKKNGNVIENKSSQNIQQPIQEIVEKKEQPKIVITSTIVKKVEGNYRYFFDIRNMGKKVFSGNVKIILISQNGEVRRDELFSTERQIEPNFGTFVFMEFNTGKPETHGEYGLDHFEYEIIENDDVVGIGNGVITNKFENLDY